VHYAASEKHSKKQDATDHASALGTHKFLAAAAGGVVNATSMQKHITAVRINFA